MTKMKWVDMGEISGTYRWLKHRGTDSDHCHYGCLITDGQMKVAIRLRHRVLTLCYPHGYPLCPAQRRIEQPVIVPTC